MRRTAFRGRGTAGRIGAEGGQAGSDGVVAQPWIGGAGSDGRSGGGQFVRHRRGALVQRGGEQPHLGDLLRAEGQPGPQHRIDGCFGLERIRHVQ